MSVYLLSKEEEKLIKEHIIKLNPACEMCGNRMWILNDKLGTLITSNHPEYYLSDDYYPVIVIMCKKCYNIKQLAAKPFLLDTDEDIIMN